MLLGLAVVGGVFGLWRGWSRWQLAGLTAAIWLAGLALLLAAPDATAVVGTGLEAWVFFGLPAAFAAGYAALLAMVKRRVRARETAMPPPDPPASFSDVELDRYARHIVLREVGGPGQQALRRAQVLVVGAGGLGAPVCLYLAAAGVGRITVADDDAVSLSNLQRQVLFRDRDLGLPKAPVAAAAMRALNPHLTVEPVERRVGEGDAALIAAHDLVIDGTDSFAARAMLNRLCVTAGRPLIGGAITQWEGQITIWDPAHGAPCMACVFPEAPAPGLAPSCAEAGVVGALPGVVGSLMALEAIKLITGAGQVLRGRMMIFDGLWGETRTIALRRDPGCPVCGGVVEAA